MLPFLWNVNIRMVLVVQYLYALWYLVLVILFPFTNNDMDLNYPNKIEPKVLLPVW